MRVFFDISHPAHVHLFKHAIGSLSENGHDVAVTSRDKEVTIELLDAYGIEHTVLSKKGTSAISLVSEWTTREIRTIRAARAFDPDVVVSRMNPPAAHAATLTGARSVVFHDTEIAGPVARLTVPFADVICTPEAYNGDFGSKHRRYRGLHELAYLHPNRFTPDPTVLGDQGISVDEPYFVLRFVGNDAHHDIGERGISPRTKHELVSKLSRRGRVYISSEGRLPSSLEPHRADIRPETIHQLLNHARLVVTDSATMATEAAVLGTPVIRSGTTAEDGLLGNFDVLAQYGLVRSIPDESELLPIVEEIADDKGAVDRWDRRRDRLLEETIDVTDFIIEIIHREGTSAAERMVPLPAQRSDSG